MRVTGCAPREPPRFSSARSGEPMRFLGLVNPAGGAELPAAAMAGGPLFFAALLPTGLLPAVLAHLRTPELARLACTCRTLYAHLRDAQYVWAMLARTWRLPLVSARASLARVGALLRLAHLQVCPVAFAGASVRPPAGALDPRAAPMRVAFNVAFLAVASARVPHAGPVLPRRVSLLPATPPPFDLVVPWPDVSLWALRPSGRVAHLDVRYRLERGGPERCLLLVDRPPVVAMLASLFTVYTHLAADWINQRPLL